MTDLQRVVIVCEQQSLFCVQTVQLHKLLLTTPVIQLLITDKHV